MNGLGRPESNRGAGDPDVVSDGDESATLVACIARLVVQLPGTRHSGTGKAPPRQKGLRMFKNVLVALKEGADHHLLLELAKKAAPPPATLHLSTLVRVHAQQDEPERLRATQAHLDKVAEGLRGDGYDVTTHVGVVAVAAGIELVHEAHDMQCDLIVIGLSKRTRVGKALMGSDAQRVLLSADCPVLVNKTY